MTPTVRETLARGAEVLRAAQIESARLDARILLACAIGAPPDSIFAIDGVAPAQQTEFERLLARRESGEPLAYITGTREFWSLSIAVGPGVLIPRPETETLVQAALEETAGVPGPLRVLDIGTGSACLLAAFLSERVQATGIGVDSSESALVYARRNLIAHGLSERAELVRSCWSVPGEHAFDVVFSNPPYLTEAEFESAAREIREHEPESSLVAGPDGLAAMRALGPVFARMLAPAGRAFLEIGAGQCEPVSKIVLSSGLEVYRVIPDLSGVPRCLMIGRPGPGGA